LFVWVHLGAAGATCAETLRQEGFIGKIVLTTSEKSLPYDRTQLSKVTLHLVVIMSLFVDSQDIGRHRFA